jgi:hypothetical protein
LITGREVSTLTPSLRNIRVLGSPPHRDSYLRRDGKPLGVVGKVRKVLVSRGT